MPHDDPTANRIGRWGRGAPSTSRSAALRNYPRSGTQRGRILRFIERRPNLGATVDDIEAASGLPHQTASARMNELMRGGWIVDSGHKRRTRNGGDAVVWKAANACQCEPRRPAGWSALSHQHHCPLRAAS